METREVRADRFKRLATNRTNEIIKKLDILGHCANRSNYEYSAVQIEQIFKAIDKKLSEVKLRFKPDDEFKL